MSMSREALDKAVGRRRRKAALNKRNKETFKATSSPSFSLLFLPFDYDHTYTHATRIRVGKVLLLFLSLCVYLCFLSFVMNILSCAKNLGGQTEDGRDKARSSSSFFFLSTM